VAGVCNLLDIADKEETRLGFKTGIRTA